MGPKIGVYDERKFTTSSFADRLGRVLSSEEFKGLIDMKEYAESLEFFARTRKAMKSEVVADLCCGHGFTGLLFAAVERSVKRVYLVDKQRPAAFTRLLEAVCEVAPHVQAKVIYLEQSVDELLSDSDAEVGGPGADVVLPRGASVLAVHGCGGATDLCMSVAIHLGGSFAAMPCCYSSGFESRGIQMPEVLGSLCGRGFAQDIHRTYLLEKEGYDVAWSAIPHRVTSKNRIIIGTRRRSS